MTSQPEEWQGPRTGPQDIEEFMKSSMWQDMVDELQVGYGILVHELVDNDALKAKGCDNFPEIKFRRGKAHAIKAMIDLPKKLLREAKEKEAYDGARYGREEKDRSGAALGGDGREPV